QFERRHLLRRLCSKRRSLLAGHDSGALFQPLRALRDTAATRPQCRECAALRCVPTLTAARLDLGIVGGLREAIRRSGRTSVRAASGPLRGVVETSLFSVHTQSATSQWRRLAARALASLPPSQQVDRSKRSRVRFL